MPRWSDLVEQAPEIADPGKDLLDDHVLAFLATTRRDGSPRVHPMVPVTAVDDLFVVIASWSPKWHDLRRDARCVLHALPGPRDDEFVLRCRGVESPWSLETVRSAANHAVHDDDHLFRLEIDQADLGWWDRVGQPNTQRHRLRWTSPDA